MTKIQDDILEMYNSLVKFSKETLEGPLQLPIKVTYSELQKSLVFEQRGQSVIMSLPNYYSGILKNINNSYLIPSDYDYLMATLSSLIESGNLIKERLCISPQNYGFDIYQADTKSLQDGPKLLGVVRFISGNTWWFKFKIRLKYKNIL